MSEIPPRLEAPWIEPARQIRGRPSTLSVILIIFQKEHSTVAHRPGLMTRAPGRAHASRDEGLSAGHEPT